MTSSLVPAEILTIILSEFSFSNQTISFGIDSMEETKSVHAAYKNENPIDFSHLPVTSDTFFSFIRSFYGKSFILNETNTYHFYCLIHYFQVDQLIDQFETHLNTHLVTWAWLKPFIKEADEGNDLRALDFVGPFLSKIDDLLIDDVMAITTEGFEVLSQSCTLAQSLSWFIKSMVNFILNQNSDFQMF
ncbi:hypothetical protein GEMRC1_004341 [Eukaryota sp. GEM-RC1]